MYHHCSIWVSATQPVLSSSSTSKRVLANITTRWSQAHGVHPIMQSQAKQQRNCNTPKRVVCSISLKWGLEFVWSPWWWSIMILQGKVECSSSIMLAWLCKGAPRDIQMMLMSMMTMMMTMMMTLVMIMTTSWQQQILEEVPQERGTGPRPPHSPPEIASVITNKI